MYCKLRPKCLSDAILLHISYQKGKPGKPPPKGKQSPSKAKTVGVGKPTDTSSSSQIKGPTPVQEPDEDKVDPKYVTQYIRYLIKTNQTSTK